MPGLSRDDRSLLETCERIELLAGRIYRVLAGVHAFDARLAGLWGKTAAEEDGHARQFKMAPRMIESMVEGVNVARERAADAVRRLEQTLQRCQSLAPTPIGALREMIRLEDDLAQFHLSQAAAFTQEGYRRLFEAMLAADRDHVGALRSALRDRGG
jgi:rubrerythrin